MQCPKASAVVKLLNADVGCYFGALLVGALVYADNLVLLVPTPSAMRKLLAVCDKNVLLDYIHRPTFISVKGNGENIINKTVMTNVRS